MHSLVLCSVLLLLSTLTASSASAATLNVVGGQLMGASNVLVDGNLYDVQFLDGTCIDLYNGCDEVSDFTFQTEASAILASQALLDQVFLDGPFGDFGSDPSLTNGCSGLDVFCWSRTPYSLFGPLYVLVVTTEHGVAGSSADARDPYIFPILRDEDTAMPFGFVFDVVSYALWSPVPEPNTALLLGLGLTGLAGKGRRRNRS